MGFLAVETVDAGRTIKHISNFASTGVRLKVERSQFKSKTLRFTPACRRRDAPSQAFVSL